MIKTFIRTFIFNKTHFFLLIFTLWNNENHSFSIALCMNLQKVSNQSRFFVFLCFVEIWGRGVHFHLSFHLFGVRRDSKIILCETMLLILDLQNIIKTVATIPPWAGSPYTRVSTAWSYIQTTFCVSLPSHSPRVSCLIPALSWAKHGPKVMSWSAWVTARCVPNVTTHLISGLGKVSLSFLC